MNLVVADSGPIQYLVLCEAIGVLPQTTGTVGILEAAAELGLLNLPAALKKLLRTNFRIDAAVIRQALERDRLR